MMNLRSYSFCRRRPGQDIGWFLAVVLVLGAIPALIAAEAPTQTTTQTTPAPDAVPTDQPSVLVVVGVPGQEQFEAPFAEQAEAWGKVIEAAGARGIFIGGDEEGKEDDRDQLKAALEAEPKTGSGEFWIVLIGHGTFDGKTAKYNLRGPDVSSDELAEWLKGFTRPVAIIDTTSSSAPFLNTMAGPNRVVVTATRSGYEENYTRFGRYFVAALTNPDADLDKDGEISLLEAYLYGSANLAEFYKTEGRLASEHPLLDDNGDGLGTPPDWFRGVRAVKRASSGAPTDGPRALQFVLIRSPEESKLTEEARAKRDALELQLAGLRDDKDKYSEDDYYNRLEEILLQIAAVYKSGG